MSDSAPTCASSTPSTGARCPRSTHLTNQQAISILQRSERGRIVGAQLHRFLDDRACSLDLDGRAAVLALLEDAFANDTGRVLCELEDAFAAEDHQ